MINYPLANTSWDDRELDAIRSVMDTGHFTMGEKVKAFEEAFAREMGSAYAVMVNSGSSANLAAVAALFFRKDGRALQRGDEVIVPAVSWSTTYYPLTQYGLKLKFVDINAQTLNMDLVALSGAITDKTRLIMAVNLLGNPNDYAAIDKIIAGRDIVIVEDNCESLGARLNGQCAGTFGMMGTFSTFFSHHISTMEGGMVVTDDEECYHLLLSIRAHGWTRNLPKDNLVYDGLKGDDFYESFLFVLPGYNLRPLEMSGAIGLHQIEKLSGFVEERRKNAAHFQAIMSDHPLVSIQQETGESSWFGFAMTVREGAGVQRQDLIDAFKANGVDCRPIVAGNFTRNPVIKWMDHEIHGDLRNADYIHDNGLFIGNHHYDVRSKLDQIVSLLSNLNGVGS